MKKCHPQGNENGKGLNHGRNVGTMSRKPAQTKASTRAHWIGNPRLLPLRDAAQWLGLTVWSLRERIWAGDIPVVKFPGGRKQFIDVQDLEEFIQRNKTTIT